MYYKVIHLCILELQPRMRGWLLGSVNGKKTGILPANYVKILGKRKGRQKVAPQDSTSLNPNQLPQYKAQPGASLLAEQANSESKDLCSASSPPKVDELQNIQYMEDTFSQLNESTPAVTDNEASQILDSAFGYRSDSPTTNSNSIANKDAADILDNST